MELGWIFVGLHRKWKRKSLSLSSPTSCSPDLQSVHSAVCQMWQLCKNARWWAKQDRILVFFFFFLVSRKRWVLPLSSFCLPNCKWPWDSYPLWTLSPWAVNLTIFKFLKPGSWTVLGDPDCKLSHPSSIAQASIWTRTSIRFCFRRSETFPLIFFHQESAIVFWREAQEIKWKAL